MGRSMTDTDESTELDRLVDEYLILQEHVDKLTDELEQIKARLRDLGEGAHKTSSGATVYVSEPPRRFDLDAASELLTLAQRAVCMRLDEREVKRWLSPVQLDSVMRAGNGRARVYVK